MRMDERKFLILRAIIDDYIMTAVPVGSRTISRKAGVGFSPATIRNEMSDLEELGYLDQPHTSAGRVPSVKAYRLYVDQLLKVSQLNDDEAQKIYEHMTNRATQTEQVIRRAAQVLSDMTQYTAIIMAPTTEMLKIKRVQLVPVSTTNALLIVVTNAGIVKDTILKVPEGLEADHLYKISTMLTEQLDGLTLTEVRQRFAEMFRDLKEYRRLYASVLDALENRMVEASGDEGVVGGPSNMLNYPEYADIEKAKSFLGILESKEKLFPLIRSTGTMEFTIRIGPENDLPELSDCSLVTAAYRIGPNTRGTMGIIGPTRMHYGRVLSVLEFMGKALGDMLSGDEP